MPKIRYEKRIMKKNCQGPRLNCLAKCGKADERGFSTRAWTMKGLDANVPFKWLEEKKHIAKKNRV